MSPKASRLRCLGIVNFLTLPERLEQNAIQQPSALVDAARIDHSDYSNAF